MTDDLLTEDWLKSVGFKWSQFNRQPTKHWTLWLGEACGKMTCFEDLGIEISHSGSSLVEFDDWFCWLRADTAGRYNRFLHVRHIRTQGELIRMIEGLTGQAWDPLNNLYGSMRSPEMAAAIRREDARLDLKFAKVKENYQVHDLS